MSASRSAAGALPGHEGDASGPARVPVLSLGGKPGAPVELPDVFSTPVRADLIHRAVVAAQSHRVQPHGTTPTAGLRHSVEWSGKGRGVARTPRLMDSMRGAQAPNTVGGRPAHPPRVERIWTKKINAKERRLAFRAAVAATRDPAVVRARGHRFEESTRLPVVVDDALEGVASSAEASHFLDRAGLLADVRRAHDGVHVRAGRGKRRGRYRREPVSLLVVTAQRGRAIGFRNLSGVDVVAVGSLGTEDLAPGGAPGRLTVYSVGALRGLAARLGDADA